jgi:ribosomal protein L22
MEQEKNTKIEEKKTARMATVKGKDLHVSTKQCMAICKFIKGKNIKQATELLENVIKFKIVVPSRGEIPHKKGISGRYPIKASEMFIKLLKSLASNCMQKSMNPDMVKLSGHADLASRSHKSGRMRGRRFKRTHVLIVAEEKI